ncbi:hypothetical protein GCM10010504_55580 [Streptomyces griseus]|nr:hypothetical protein GCM10010504_55580 [Streptomyces griseus]
MKRAPRTGLRQNPGSAGVRGARGESVRVRILRRSGMEPTLSGEHRRRADATPDEILTSRPGGASTGMPVDGKRVPVDENRDAGGAGNLTVR